MTTYSTVIKAEANAVAMRLTGAKDPQYVRTNLCGYNEDDPDELAICFFGYGRGDIVGQGSNHADGYDYDEAEARAQKAIKEDPVGYMRKLKQAIFGTDL